MSIIARTAGIGRSLEELQWDLNYLLQLWRAIENASRLQAGAFLIYQEGSLVIRAIRDYFQPDIGEILIDTEAIYDQAVQFMAHVMPNNVNKVKLYKDDVPLFSRFQIEHQIETAFSREVPLPSGGAIVIDHTEALVSVDVNSARATRGADIEQTAFNTNLEAAEEVARQLRLRDLGGLVVIDFIDMESQRNQRDVENRLRDALRYDRARVQMGKISRFGLLELSRQRLQPSLGETSHISCPRCHGTGHIRGTESSALHILRILQEEAMKENTAALHAQVPVDVATFLLNEKRADIYAIESRFHLNIVLIPNIHMETPHYSITRLRESELREAEAAELPSYRMVEKPAEPEAETPAGEAKAPRQIAAVRGITPEQPAPTRVEEKKEEETQSWFGKIRSWLNSLGAPKKEEEKPAAPARGRQAREGRGPRREREGGRGEGRRGERAERGERPERGERAPEGRKEQKPRQPKREAAAAPEKAPSAAPVEKVAEGAPQEAQEPRGRRGRRGGRRERGEPREARAAAAGEAAEMAEVAKPAAAERPAREPREPRETLAEAPQPAPQVEAVTEEMAPPPAPTGWHEPVSAKAAPEPEQAPAEVAPAAPQAAPQIEEPKAEAFVEEMKAEAAKVEEVKAEAPAPAPAPIAEAKPAAPVLEQVETATATVPEAAPAAEEAPAPRPPRRRPAQEAAPETGGLVMVETNPVKVEQAAAAPAEETAPTAQPRRQRPRPASQEPVELVQVETRRSE
jgi:ribonuclease E